MIIPGLALKNLLGAGLRTWLNCIVLSLSFVVIVWSQGFYQGMGERAERAMVEWEIGAGQYWQANYDPYDPFTLQDAHAIIPDTLQQFIERQKAAAILITQATAYPQGRMLPILLKGIDPAQNVLALPAQFLAGNDEILPALIGNRMAESAKLRIGDEVTIRWRDVHGAFDAREARIVQIMQTIVTTVDAGQIWVPLDSLQAMLGAGNEATIVVVDQTVPSAPQVAGWDFRDQDELLRDLREMVRAKSVGASIFYALLLFLALLAIFNTQVLSIFRRRKEIGTLMSLGMTRARVIQLFTLEGGLTGVLAALLGAVYGIPLMAYFATNGWKVPEMTDSFGFSIGHTLYPTYSIALVAGTTFFVLVAVTIVSYLPVRKIARLKPTDALRGKLP